MIQASKGNEMPVGRPRTATPEKEELIKLGEQLVQWASEKAKKGEPLRVRFCDWYTTEGLVRKQWEHMREKTEFQWYYERARSLMSLRYIDGTVHHSIAHRYLRIYDPELRDEEDRDAEAAERRKAAASKGEANEKAKAIAEILDEIQRNKRKLE